MTNVYRVHAKKPTRIGSIMATKYYVGLTDLPEFKSRLVFAGRTYLHMIGARLGITGLDTSVSTETVIVVPIKTATIGAESNQPRPWEPCVPYPKAVHRWA